MITTSCLGDFTASPPAELSTPHLAAESSATPSTRPSPLTNASRIADVASGTGRLAPGSGPRPPDRDVRRLRHLPWSRPQPAVWLPSNVTLPGMGNVRAAGPGGPGRRVRRAAHPPRSPSSSRTGDLGRTRSAIWLRLLKPGGYCTSSGRRWMLTTRLWRAQGGERGQGGRRCGQMEAMMRSPICRGVVVPALEGAIRGPLALRRWRVYIGRSRICRWWKLHTDCHAALSFAEIASKLEGGGVSVGSKSRACCKALGKETAQGAVQGGGGLQGRFRGEEDGRGIELRLS